MLKQLKQAIHGIVRRLGYDIVVVGGKAAPRKPLFLARDGNAIPDYEFYTPRFSPWKGYGPFARYYGLAAPHAQVTADRCWVLYSLALQCQRLEGDLWECGVYKGGTARMLAQILADSQKSESAKLHLFDTFGGMPETDKTRDTHKAGDFSDTSLESVQAHVGQDNLVVYHPGMIPGTFTGMEKCRISFAHVDVDIYQSVKECCEFILPRLLVGGVMVFDDYGFPTCPGARQAVDEFFRFTPFTPLVLPTGQALVFKSREWNPV
jgi:O-methyltransferase